MSKEWVKSDGLLAYYIDDEWTGIVIVPLDGRWAKPYKPVTYHVRHYVRCRDLADMPNLRDAMSWVESHYNELWH